MAESDGRRTVTAEYISIGLGIGSALGFLLGAVVGGSVAWAAFAATTGGCLAVPIALLEARRASRTRSVTPAHPGGCGGLATRLRPSVVLGPVLALALVLFVGVSARDPAGGNHGATGDNRETTPPPVGTTPAISSPVTAPPARSTSPAASPGPSASEPTGGGWPIGSQDGTPALYAYFGSQLFFPDWVSCEETYCLAGDGSKIRLYRQQPLDQLDRFDAGVPDPYEKLITLGMSRAQARALLKLD